MALRLLTAAEEGKPTRESNPIVHVFAFETRIGQIRGGEDDGDRVLTLSSCRCSERCSLRTPIYIHGSRRLRGTKGWRQADHVIELLRRIIEG